MKQKKFSMSEILVCRITENIIMIYRYFRYIGIPSIPNSSLTTAVLTFAFNLIGIPLSVVIALFLGNPSCSEADLKLTQYGL